MEWLDCILLRNEWVDDDDLGDLASVIVSVGFRVKSEDGFLFLAATWQRDEKHLSWAQTIAIPERAIVRKRRLDGR